MASIKELRLATGMTQRSFTSVYHIPLQTLKQWESHPGSAAYRVPPQYVLHMLERLVSVDFDVRFASPNSKTDYLINAAEQSRYSGSHWMRYLRKEVDSDSVSLDEGDMARLLASDRLTMFQKVSLKRCMQQNTATNKYAVSLNKKAEPRMLNELQRKLANVEK